MAERKRPAPKKGESHVIATERAIVIALGEDDQRAAQDCLEKSGKVSFSLKEVSVTELPNARAASSGIITID